MVAEKPQHYTALARRFRPQAFNDVIGQNHVAQALQNAIKSGRVAHAYLFTGARGVGKTSTARILAKALNCPNVVDGIPCNNCEICDGITSGNDVDVLEIDGASNRGIDDIRSLRANVNVRSMRTQFKMYIIDEVHMLTREAFNALLKTLEEPPPNVKFVFCTTEPNKVPDTILSRCQRFDFSSISTDNITNRLAQIAEAEGFEVAPEAIDLVARRAAGSMRDSQSLFDQLLAFGGEKISADDVHRLFGTADDERLIRIFTAVIARDQKSVLMEFDSALSQGVQASEFFDQLLYYARDLMLIASGAAGVGLQSVAESSRQTLAEQAEQWGLQTIVSAMQILADTRTRLARVTHGRSLIELALVRVSMLEDLAQIGKLLQAVASGNFDLSNISDGAKKKIPERMTGSAAEAQPPVPPPAPASIAEPAPEQPATEPATEQPVSAAPTNVEPVPGDRTEPPAEPPNDSPTATGDSPTHSRSATAETAQVTTSAPVAEREDVRPVGTGPTAPQVTEIPMPQPAAEMPVSSSSEPESLPAAETAPATQIALSEGNEAQFLQELRNRLPDKLKHQFLRVDSCAIFGPNRLELRIPKSYTFSKRKLEQPENLTALQNTAIEIAAQPVQISFTVVENAAQEAVAADSGPKKAPVGRLKPEIPADDEFVQHAADIFGGTVVRVMPIQTKPETDGT